MKVAIIIADSNSACPVPAVNGGAVATVVEHLVEQNHLDRKLDMTVYSYYDTFACEKAKDYNNVHFVWIKIPKIIKEVDKFIFWVITHFFKKKKAISFKSIASLMTYVFCTAKKLKNSEYDALVLENNMVISWILRLYGNGIRYKGKCFYHLHNIPRINAKNSKVFDEKMSYICVSDYVRKQITKNSNPIGPVNEKQIHILKNCIDIAIYRQNVSDDILDQYRRKYSLGEKDRVVIFTGRLTKEKGVDQVVRAMELVRTPNVKLLVVGSTLISGVVQDEFMQNMRKLTDDKKDRIIFTGYVNQKEMPSLYRLADIAVLPSMWEEPAGLTMIEAMACGTPVITTNAGGIPEYTTKGASILLEREENLYIDIAKNIDYLLENESVRKRVAEKGQEFVITHNSMESYLKNFLEIIGG